MSQTVASKPSNSRVVFVIIALLCLITAVYMTIVIKKVPRTVESSRAGPFPELIKAIEAFHQASPSLVQGEKVWDREQVNQSLVALVPFEGMALKRAADNYQLLAVREEKLEDRPLLQILLKTPEEQLISLHLYAVSKRHFPKTRSFVHRAAWFFQYGKDIQTDTELKPEALAVLKDRPLNLVATNYGNDYYLLLAGELPALDLAKHLFAATTIFSPKK